MMTRGTVQQLLQVFRLFRENHAGGKALHRSYQDAVREVAKLHSITYQTVGDGCRRRLRLKDIGGLYQLLETWVMGDSRSLARQLKQNADPSMHAEIDKFFADGASAGAEITRPEPKSPAQDETEAFSFRLLAGDARMLKALAELEGISVPELTAREISTAVRDRMTTIARGILKRAESHA